MVVLYNVDANWQHCVVGRIWKQYYLYLSVYEL